MKTFRDYCVLIVIFLIGYLLARFIEDNTGWNLLFTIGFLCGAIYYDGYKKFSQ